MPKKVFFVLVFGLTAISTYSIIFYSKKKPISTNLLPYYRSNDHIDYSSYTFTKLKFYKSTHTSIRIVLPKTQRFERIHTSILSINKQGKQISNYVNIPATPGLYPIAILIRGYVDKEIYSPGVGTQRIGEFLANNGYITIAPDFLGYGESSKASTDSLEERFQTYTTVLDLINAIPSLNKALEKAGINDVKADSEKIMLWGHSNGGHIALSILAITGKKYPTVLWAPVSKPFPYSILYYTDEYSDKGKYLRKIIADFEDDYDISKFDPTNYYKWIKAPIQIHQGTLDDAVPLKWSIQLSETLDKLGINSELIIHENSDHNLMPDGWYSAASDSLIHFNTNLDNYE